MQWLQLQYDWEINLPLENKDTNDIKKMITKIFIFISVTFVHESSMSPDKFDEWTNQTRWLFCEWYCSKSVVL